jgi:hypothetical protein
MVIKLLSPIPLAESSWDMEAIKSAAMAAEETSAVGLNWTLLNGCGS